ncbi:NAD(P)H-quinone oxidoreductase [Photorhabdus luminescens]|uniref:NAD(P)H-quinone oxidoreductase n=1 Tax=Photorhabdus luminescens TaxID=29488 RepID=UPI0022406891|nr:NAD(P)H-quinone oxidoreductase [Photorhabdus luminescens]MCW7762775.1 NAD(P)H-quinone oxidoreductase [Photorhabdus luminescens subsp. venezuelensis]
MHSQINSLPQYMSAISIIKPGGPEKLHLVQVPLPRPGKGYLLVKVAAAGVNRPDIFQRMGSYPPPPDASPLPGLEIAGEVVAKGEGCERWNLGDKVCALVAGGGYAEYCLVHDSVALPIYGLDFVQAAALPENFFTVWANVFQTGKLKHGENLLIHGGTSGIGSVTIMLAKAFGAKVITTVGSDEKAKVAHSLGADFVINYRKEDFVDRVLKITGNHGVDIVVDLIGGDYVNKNYKVAAKFGRIIQIGMMKGNPENLNLMPLMLKRLTHTGSTLRSRSVEEKAEIARELEKNVWSLLKSGKVSPLICKVFDLKDAADAHRMMEAGDVIGKVMLVNVSS